MFVFVKTWYVGQVETKHKQFLLIWKDLQLAYTWHKSRPFNPTAKYKEKAEPAMTE